MFAQSTNHHTAIPLFSDDSKNFQWPYALKANSSVRCYGHFIAGTSLRWDHSKWEMPFKIIRAVLVLSSY